MVTESKRYSELVHEPPCTTWPPPWLTPSTLPPSTPPARVAGEPTPPEPPADVSPWDLPPDLYERWEERTCIMHYDNKMPWREAEALALADVLSSNPDAKPETGNTGEEEGPYRRGL